TLWSITVYMVLHKQPWIMAFLPALYMTVVCSTYLFIAPECVHLDATLSYILGGACGAAAIAVFFRWKNKKINIE
ncbi:MAG: carbon starvation protein A, partial [Bacteroidales bacterium]|nr:carbon starvation protein A [Bacteroidales bacterium]